jgi:hypothetical protein
MNYIINSAGIVLFLDNKPTKLEKGSSQYAKIIEAFDLPENQQEAAIRKALEKTAERVEKNGFKISPEEVSYKGETLPKALADKVRSIHREGLPLNLFEKFWQNLQDNPSSSSVNELYEFLAYKELPITENGCFLAYKGLESNLWSISGNKETKVVKGVVDERGRILNSIGAEIEVKRRDVDDNRDHHCSFGLHVGSLDYARGFAHGAVVVVKVNPKDVVSVPKDYSCQKCRVSAYKVVSVFEQEIKAPVVDESNEPVQNETVQKRSEFVERINKYLDGAKKKGYSAVNIRKIQNSFSPEYPSKNRVLDALAELGYYWFEGDEGLEIDLED